jgi:hypothetical protein
VSGQLQEDNWNHIAAVYDGNSMNLIVNGQSLGELTFSGTVSTSDLSLFIGADPTEGGGLYLPCKIDEVRIWNGARSFNQVISLMYDTLSTVYYESSDSGLVAYYRFDQLEDLGINSDGADDIRDLSVNANHGDTQGDPNLVISDAMTWIAESDPQLANEFWLGQNYPNPFNPRTTIKYQLAKQSEIELSVYNLLGQKIAVLLKTVQVAGNYELEFNAGNLPSGIYYYRIEAGEYHDVKKMIIIK